MRLLVGIVLFGCKVLMFIETWFLIGIYLVIWNLKHDFRSEDAL